MVAEIITIGEELLIGQVIDTNSAWLGEQLNLIGIPIIQRTSISDKRDHILRTLADAASRADLILITGGLGPTRDDVTKQALCEYFDTSLVFNQEAFENIQRLFTARGQVPNELNRQQAFVPAACKVLPNTEGTAPGMWFTKDSRIYVSMPGVPFEMMTMFTNHVLPELKKIAGTQLILHKTVLTIGIGESVLSTLIEDWENKLPENFRLAYLPQPGMVRLRLTARGDHQETLISQINEQIDKLLSIIPDFVFGFDNDTLELVIGRLLKKQGKTIATAESCTGGYIAHLITSVPGSSEYYLGSVIAYANEVKMAQLGVDSESLRAFGAVSEQVALQMASGVKERLGSDFGIGVTGIAGPDGGTPEKPVGTTWIALATPEKTFARKFLLGENRLRNIRKAALEALNMLRLELVHRDNSITSSIREF